MPSIADGNLDKSTTESPAIIQGAAVGYEEKTGPADYKTLKDRIFAEKTEAECESMLVEYLPRAEACAARVMERIRG